MIKSIKIQTFHSLASSYSKSFPPMIWFLLIKNLHDISRSITHIWTLKLSLESKKNKLETQNVRERERRTCDGGEGARVLKGGEEGELRGSKGGGGGEERGFGWEWGRKTMWYLRISVFITVHAHCPRRIKSIFCKSSLIHTFSNLMLFLFSFDIYCIAVENNLI